MLFEPLALGETELKNRVVMAPMTRRRADTKTLAADALTAKYYEQRASAGLIIAEGSQISPEAYGYFGSPGCYNEVQTEGWKLVTQAVHAKGGKIFLQLWHVGPFSHRLLQPGQKLPVSASPVIPDGDCFTPEGHKPYEASRQMTREEIYKTINDYGKSAANAISTGFDGVEIHGAHAYLIDQFIMDATNKRTDEFGGSIENRSRFLFLVIEEILKNVPSEKLGLRLSPMGYRPGMMDSNPEKTFGSIVSRLNDYILAYLHISEMVTPEFRLNHPDKSIVPFYKQIYKGTLISCGGHTLESAERMLQNGDADLIAFGKFFISNPDLVERFRTGAPLAEPDKSTFYRGGENGYVDYPVWRE